MGIVTTIRSLSINETVKQNACHDLLSCSILELFNVSFSRLMVSLVDRVKHLNEIIKVERRILGKKELELS